MKKNFSFVVFILFTFSVHSQALKKTSYINKEREKVLRIEISLPVDIETAWALFTNDEKLKKWIAPLAHIELRSGGYIITNYDTTKNLSDSTSILLPITSFIDNELLILKVILNGNFARSVRDTDKNLQEIIQFQSVDNHQTKIISSMIGWGNGPDWDKTYLFFEKGNEWTYEQLIKNFMR